MLTAAPRLRAQANVIYSFGGYSTDGETPYTTYLLADSAGNLYGTTTESISSGGTVFELSPQTLGGWSEQIIAYLSSPQSNLVMDGAGNIYGVDTFGGDYRYGDVFELSPLGATWNLTLLHSFRPNGHDGIFPESGLIMDAAGNLYGVTSTGGSSNEGTVFEITKGSGGTWTEKILHNFSNDGTDGINPNGILAMDASGNLYGTAYNGGTWGVGIVFELTSNSGWSETILHAFTYTGTAPMDGANPNANVIFFNGNLYGTTYEGGPHNNGTVFQLIHHGNGTWSESVIHAFNQNGIDGATPRAGLALVDGTLYGTTSAGGSAYAGTVFGLSHHGTAWTESYLYSFPEAGTGAEFPSGGLILYSDGNLYGTAQGGANGVGSVYEIAP
jgi:uncharacterized repeat protein (TIGR03803 family)